ncbi:MAG: DHH family phosphoesterase [Clostridiales bacterium]|jgi:single-stranded-DNA-specific exonuclease|nr:DHH family phosphoesterase [Clostridiales bacterium]
MKIRYKKRKTIDRNLAAELSEKTGLSLLAADLLVSAGAESEEEIGRFLNPGKADFLDPFRLPDMRAAAERILSAQKNGERIVVYGDYDCDGVCAAAILYGFLRDKTEVFYYIPNRKDGYGLSVFAIDKIAENVFPDLIITVDCGIASAAEVEYAKELGIDIIITDHHTPQEIFPDTLILNPKVKYSYEERKKRNNINIDVNAEANENKNVSTNRNINGNANADIHVNENISANPDINSNENINGNANENKNDNANENSKRNENDNADLNENANENISADSNKKVNSNSNENVNSNIAAPCGNPEKPKNEPDGYPNPLCGAGVAFKLVEAVGGFAAAEKFLGLAAIATVGDIVPLTGENRAITALGLSALNESRAPVGKGLKRLCAALKLEKITASDIAFMIAPRLNAAGRMGIADRALELLISDDYFNIDCLINELNADNKERQTVLTDIVNDVYDKLLGEDLNGTRCIVLADEGWDGGVLGIACAKIAEQFNRPVILFTENEGILKGSARSIDGIDIFEAISRSKELFTAFGGHAQAAGVSLKRENIDVFRREINDFLKKYDESVFAPEIIYDAILEKKPTLSEIKEIGRLEPFGEGNPKPLFLSFENEMNFLRIKNTRHIREKTGNYETVGFNMTDTAEFLNSGTKKAVLTTIERAEYNNTEYLKAVVAGCFAAEVEACFDRERLLEAYVSAAAFSPKADKKKARKKGKDGSAVSVKDGDNILQAESAISAADSDIDKKISGDITKDGSAVSVKDGDNILQAESTISAADSNTDKKISGNAVKRFEKNQLKAIINETGRLYGTAFAAFDDKTAAGFYKLFNEIAPDKLLIFCYRSAESKNPYNRLILSPKDAAFEYYDRVVFLDPPLFDPSEYTAAEVFVSGGENPLNAELRAAGLSDSAVREIYIRIRAFVKDGGTAEGGLRAVYARIVSDRKFSNTEFAAAFSVFAELGLLKIDRDGRITLTENKTNLENSAIYKACGAGK